MNKTICGIYQILNTTNGKSYIGQSRNIRKRWRQHTAGLERTEALERGSYPLRSAFLKYGLKQFDFKIIEECIESNLLIREKYWIDQIQPEYNCNLWTPGRKKQTEKTKPKVWIQYHNYNKLGYLPGELLLDDFDNGVERFQDELSGISTGKRAILNAKGDTAFLIVGIGENPKQYYLMYRFVIEDIQIREGAEAASKGEMLYDAFGDGWFVNPPQLLNSSDFDTFRKYCGNFGFGFMAVNRSPYSETLNNLSKLHKSENIDFPKYIEKFYSEVAANNPNEVSVLDKRGVARHLAISVYPDEAVLILHGAITKIVLFGINELVVKYEGRLLIHTLGFYEEFEPEFRDQFKENCLNILNNFELDQETFPAHAIQGWVNVQKIFKYDKDSFAIDKDAHGKGEDLDEYRIECGFSECDAWCVEVNQPVLFEEPIPLTEPEDVQEGDPWLPTSELEIGAFRLALENTVQEI
jgi:hypothetical protein